VLQKQREDLERAVEENKVLKSRYDNILEVGFYTKMNAPQLTYLVLQLCCSARSCICLVSTRYNFVYINFED